MSQKNSILQLLEKTNDLDKDERYMATSDLCQELQKENVVTTELESKICTAVLRQLDDKSNTVQSIAVKCLGILVTKVHQSQVMDISQKLCELLVSGSPELRDIYSIGLKTLISDVPHIMGKSVSPTLCTKLYGALQHENTDLKLQCLEIFSDLFNRFGLSLTCSHEKLLGAIRTHLQHEQPIIRKRATTALGNLSKVLAEGLLLDLVEDLLQAIDKAMTPSEAGTVVQTLGVLVRSVGHRLGKKMDVIVPLLLQFCAREEEAEDMETETSDELRENCLTGLEALVLKCPAALQVHLPQVLNTVLTYMQYDPNFCYENYDDGEEGMEVDDGEEDEEYSDADCDDLSDDDDTSWKVRRASLRVLTAVLNTRCDTLDTDTTARELIGRFKEREESVRLDVFICFSTLLHTTSGTVTDEHVVSVIKACKPHWSSKSSGKTRGAVFQMFRELLKVVPQGVKAHVEVIMAPLCIALDDRNSSIKNESLLLLRALLATYSPTLTQLHEILPLVVQCVGDKWYKNIAEGLRVLASLFPSMATLPKKEVSLLVPSAFICIFSRLQSSDIDQEIKEEAITTMGKLLSTLGGYLEKESQSVLPLLVERLQNEITRMAALKALAVIARSETPVDLSSILQESVLTLASFLRQQSRTLKETTLDTLTALVQNNGATMLPEVHNRILEETSLLVNQSDLHLSQLSLDLAVTVLTTCSTEKIAIASQETLIEGAITLTHSPLVQGSVRSSLRNFIGTVIRCGYDDFDRLWSALMLKVEQGYDLTQQALLTIAQCIATLCVTEGDTPRQQQQVQGLVDGIDSGNLNVQRLSLFCLGEIGREFDLSALPQVQTKILNAVESGSEETKGAAAHALGLLIVGNVTSYLPFLLQALQDRPALHYLLFSALKDAIVQHAAFAPHVSSVLPVLYSQCENTEEAVRNMVAECLGRCAILTPAEIIPFLLSSCASKTTMATRWTAVTAMKFCMTHPYTMETYILPDVTAFWVTLKDDDIAVRRASLLTLNAVAHQHPMWLTSALSAYILPALQTTMNLKMQRIVDLGPFKHKVDDAAIVRKAAYGCMDTLLGYLSGSIDLPAFFPFLQNGLTDEDDIQMISWPLLVKMCVLSPGAILASLTTLWISPMDKAVHRKVKDSKVATDVDRANDLIRSALRGVDAIQQLEGSAHCIAFQDFLTRLKKQEKFKNMLDALVLERP